MQRGCANCLPKNRLSLCRCWEIPGVWKLICFHQKMELFGLSKNHGTKSCVMYTNYILIINLLLCTKWLMDFWSRNPWRVRGPPKPYKAPLMMQSSWDHWFWPRDSSADIQGHLLRVKVFLHPKKTYLKHLPPQEVWLDVPPRSWDCKKNIQQFFSPCLDTMIRWIYTAHPGCSRCHPGFLQIE